MKKILLTIKDFFGLSRLTLKKSYKKAYIIILSVVMVNMLFSPTPGFAEKLDENKGFFDIKLVLSMKNGFTLDKLLNKSSVFSEKTINRLPANKKLEKVAYKLNVVLTAYNSEVGQCDSTPCITANGFNLCKNGKEDSIAMNGIRLGTRVRIPALYGDRVFVVRDRMNARYNISRADIWMLNKTDAIKFGAKRALIEVLAL